MQQEHFIHARSGGVAGISALCSTFGHCCLGGYGIFSENVLIDVYNTVLNYFTTVHKSLTYSLGQGLWNEGIYQRNLKIWGNVADKICFGCTLNFGSGFLAVRVISSLGVHSPWHRASCSSTLIPPSWIFLKLDRNVVVFNCQSCEITDTLFNP